MIEFLKSLRTAFFDGRGRFTELMLGLSSFVWAIAVITAPTKAGFNTLVLSDLMWFGANGTILAMPWLIASILHVIGIGFYLFPIRWIACALSLILWMFVCVKVILIGWIEGHYWFPPSGLYLAAVVSAGRGLIWGWLRKS